MKKSELDALAHEIALSAAQSDIESFCVPQQWTGVFFGTWYDTSATPGEGFEAKAVSNAVRYLDALGKLERHRGNKALVRVKVLA